MSQTVATQIGGAALRQAFGRFPTGIAALCGYVDGAPVGFAANSFTSVSLDPPLVSVCIQKTSTTWPVLRRSTRIGISVLGAAHEQVCRKLSKKGVDRFDGVDWHKTDEDAVLVRDSVLELECTLEEEVDAGDHFIILLRVQGLKVQSEVSPLVFHDSRYRMLAVPAAV
jgi:flavin reductase (DIM6/NTAB) family NADH-FMN oxidoreductase RutF